jgi:RNA polymerase sigma-70 factor (ECF subfamily)
MPIAEPGSAVENDRELVRAARGGDRAAYGRLYERYAPMVHGVLLARVAPELVDDLLQDVFLKAMTQLRSLREEDHFGGWIAAIARNRAADHYRRAREIAAGDGVSAIMVTERSSATAEARAALRALQSLPDAYRETLTLRLVEGLTGPEIAARTGLTHDSVRVNLHRGMKQLRERLGVAPDAGKETDD